MVSSTAIAFMGFSMVFCTALPIVLAVVFKKKYRASLKAFFAGCAGWFVFAVVLEAVFHSLVLNTQLGAVIRNNIWLYAIYGGLAAGLFEETGRFVAMKYIINNHHDNDYNSLMYGAGHGGFEAFLLMGTQMLNYLVYSLMINSGEVETLLASVPAEQKMQIEEIIKSLTELKGYTVLLGDMERISAMAMHIAFSVLVWIAVTKGKTYFYPLAILLHMAADTVSVMLAQFIPAAAAELLIMAIAAGMVVFAVKSWRLYMTGEPDVKKEKIG